MTTLTEIANSVRGVETRERALRATFQEAVEKLLAKFQLFDFSDDEQNEIEFNSARTELEDLYIAALRGKADA